MLLRPPTETRISINLPTQKNYPINQLKTMTNPNLDQLQSSLGHHYQDIQLLKTALSHRSYLNESNQSVSNERLEFLGDAVLELVISEYLYLQKPDEPEGTLTAARSAIVRTESLAKVATQLNLGEYLFMSKGEEKSGGRHNISLLANTTEAIIGSIYLDGGLQSAQDFIHRHILPLAENILDSDNLKDPKSLLQEKVQELGFTSPVYTTDSETGPDHNKTFTVTVSVNHQPLATGKGKNKQAAQQDAARQALNNTQRLAPKT